MSARTSYKTQRVALAAAASFRRPGLRLDSGQAFWIVGEELFDRSRVFLGVAGDARRPETGERNIDHAAIDAVLSAFIPGQRTLVLGTRYSRVFERLIKPNAFDGYRPDG